MPPIRRKVTEIPKSCPYCKCKAETGGRRCLVCGNPVTSTPPFLFPGATSAESRLVLSEIIHGPCKVKDHRFVDSDFLPSNKSLRGASKNRLRKQVTSWKRLQFLLPGGIDVNLLPLFGKASVSDIDQGNLGNCGLLAAIGALASQPQLLETIFRDRRVRSCGSYRFSLFAQHEGSTEWQPTPTIVDDLVPCSGDRPTFSRVIGTQVWVPLLEKAIAKLRGSYLALDRIPVAESFGHMIGKKTVQIQLEARGATDASLWSKLNASKKALMTATSKLNPNLKKNDNHCFTVLGLYAVEDLQLVKIRNPHGKSSIPMADSLNLDSPLWSRMEPAISPCKEEHLDGIYWMLFADFLKHFRRVDLCDLTS